MDMGPQGNPIGCPSVLLLRWMIWKRVLLLVHHRLEAWSAKTICLVIQRWPASVIQGARYPQIFVSILIMFSITTAFRQFSWVTPSRSACNIPKLTRLVRDFVSVQFLAQFTYFGGVDDQLCGSLLAGQLPWCLCGHFQSLPKSD